MLDLEQFKPQDNYSDYTPTDEERVLISYVDKNFQRDKSARTAVDKDWDLYQTMLDAKRKPYGDERSTSSIQLADTLIEQYVAEAIKIPTDYLFKAETKDHATATKTLEHAWKDDRRKNNRKRVFFEDEHNVGAFGNSFIYTGFESYEKVQHNYDPTGDVRNEVTLKKESIIVDNIDIRMFYLDSEAIKGIDDASRCVYDQRLSYDRFRLLETNKLYKNIRAVKPRAYSNQRKTFVTQEDATKQGDFVHLRHFWDIEKDLYIIIANGIVVRCHPIVSTIDGEKALPFVMRGLGYKTYSIYSRGFCEAAMYFNSDINTLRELCMDACLRSNVDKIAIGPGISFTGRGFSFKNDIITFDGTNFDQNFKQISGTPPNAAIFNYMDRLYKDIAVYVGIDINNIIGTPNKTAFEVEVQREASQKRINVWLMSRDLAYERFANLHAENIKKFYARPDKEGNYPTIQIEGEELKDGKYKKKKGSSLLVVKPELMQGKSYIDVYTNTNATTVNAVDRAQRLEFFNSLPNIINTYTMAKQSGYDLESIISFKTTITDLADDNNIETTSGTDQEDVQAEKNKIIEQLKGMMPPVDGMPQLGAEQSVQGQQPQPVQDLAPKPPVGSPVAQVA